MPKTRILIPLDGSPLAESALPEANTLAKALGAEVLLLQVVPIPEEVINEGLRTIAIDEQWMAHKGRALAYLNGVRGRPEWAGIDVAVGVETGSPAEAILKVCRDKAIDRIVMATHGRTGLTRWMLGSVADKVLRAAETTIVLVRAATPSQGAA